MRNAGDHHTSKLHHVRTHHAPTPLQHGRGKSINKLGFAAHIHFTSSGQLHQVDHSKVRVLNRKSPHYTGLLETNTNYAWP